MNILYKSILQIVFYTVQPRNKISYAAAQSFVDHIYEYIQVPPNLYEKNN